MSKHFYTTCVNIFNNSLYFIDLIKSYNMFLERLEYCDINSDYEGVCKSKNYYI